MANFTFSYCRFALLFFTATLHAAALAVAEERVLDERLHYLRVGSESEWSEFPREAEGPSLVVRFQGTENATEATLRLRQQDVKQPWKVLLNDKSLGRLVQDENDTVIFLPIPVGALAAGENRLVIEQMGRTPDDIRVGSIVLDDRPRDTVLSECTLDVSVLDATSADKPTPVPCRITVLDSRGALMTTAATSGGHLAVRPGVLYTGTGRAKFGLPAGEYTLYAGRGLEYSIETVRLSLKRGETVRKQLTIRREVPTEGYVSCDPHIHTLTHSGHGDATAEERALTLAGEGIELPIATEHNRQVDYDAASRKQSVRQYFTPVIGNEVTTSLGHFNVFPVPAGGPLPDHQLKDGNAILDNVAARTGARVTILNHPRDVHAGFRPFGPARHNAATGENAATWLLRANAMEVVNAGAQQTDVLRLYRDWFSLLNRGVHLTPIGASDSHDVSRFIVGQGRTYIRCKDDEPGKIDVGEAVTNLLAGRVMVSCGLLAEITVDGRYGPGDLVSSSGETRVVVRVLGPGWVTAHTVSLYANGIAIREADIPDGKRPGVKWRGAWTLPRFTHDVHLAAIATGPAVSELYWPISKPYQPTSPVVERMVIGSTGAVWVDADGDGKRTSALDYAKKLSSAAGDDTRKLVLSLGDYDEAVATQTAGLLSARGVSTTEPTIAEAAKKAGPHVEHGFRSFLAAWRECQIARRRAEEP